MSPESRSLWSKKAQVIEFSEKAASHEKEVTARGRAHRRRPGSPSGQRAFFGFAKTWRDGFRNSIY